MILPSFAAIPAEVPQAPVGPQQTQNMFEYMAAQSLGLPEAANPAQLAQEVIERMQGFIERTTRYSRTGLSGDDGAGEITGGFASAPRESAKGNPSADFARPTPGDERMNKVIDSLGKMFEYSTEVAVVARNASGITSSVNTLLRGQ